MLPTTIAAAPLGVASHLIFRHHEPKPGSFAAVVVLLSSAIFTQDAFAQHTSIISAFLHAVRFNAIYFAVLAAAILIYRLAPWHPLAAYPGPTAAAVSKWWMVNNILAKGGRHLELKRAHEKYGTWVRVGPNELSICDAAAIAPIYNKLDRSEFHRGAPAKADTLILVLDRQRHSERRQVWNRALNAQSLQVYAGYAETLGKELIGHITHDVQKNSGLVNVNHWLNLYFMDLMGMMGFSGGFQTMKEGGDKEGWISMFAMGVCFAVSMGQVPWMRGFLEAIPQKGPIERFQKFILKKVDEIERENKQQKKGVTRDIMSTLLDESSGVKLSHDEAVADAGLIMVGATDTSVQAVLTILPSFVVGLCSPSTASGRGPPRTTGPTGAVILDRYVPPRTTVHVPTYSIHHSVENWGPLVEEYIPERWLITPDQSGTIESNGIKIPVDSLRPCNRQAFMPFAAGWGVCVGRALGLQNSKIAAALLVHAFDILPDPSFDGKAYDGSFKEYGLWSHDELKLVLSNRA
ncbi:cytochrome P450 [Flagelloscypha sp. PMI_526]|nr:cytochrome P450 [Flagelloscypha sp. PMI_526]